MRSVYTSVALFACLIFSAEAIAFPVGDLQPVRCQFGKGGNFTSADEYFIYLKHDQDDELKYFDKNCDGKLDKTELKALTAYRLEQDNKLRADAETEFARARRYGSGVNVPKLPPPPPAPVYGGWSSQFVLRDSFEDIGIFSAPKKKSLASGASFSYERDNEVRNTTWSAKGVAAYPFSWAAPPLEFGRHADYVPFIVGFALTPSMSFQKVSNSTASIAAKKDVDVLTFNAGGEVAVAHFLDNTTTHYFRTRAGIVTNFTGKTRSWNIVSEWQPITHWKNLPNFSTPHSLFGLPIQTETDFIFRTHYAKKVSNDLDDPLFDRGDDVFRFGPVLAFSMTPVADDLSLADWFKRTTFTATYSWLNNPRTSQSYGLFNTSLSYAFDKEQTLGLKLSYEKGKVEETAQDVATTKLGLTGKF